MTLIRKMFTAGRCAKTRAIIGLLLVCASPSRIIAANFDEAVSGDISNDRLAPTVVALAAGSNFVQGHFGQSPVPNVRDLDYFTVTVPAGHRLDAIVLTSLVAGGANAFLGVQVGPVMTMASTSVDPSPLLGWTHTYTNQIGTNLLPAMAITGPLAAGSYTFWSQETDTSAVWTYGYNFQVSALAVAPPASVPVPTWALMVLAAALVGTALTMGSPFFRRTESLRAPPS